MDLLLFTLLFDIIPFLALAVIYLGLLWFNRHTTGELKRLVPPSLLLRVVAVIVITDAVVSLALFKVLDTSTVAALLGSLATGVFSIEANRKNREDLE